MFQNYVVFIPAKKYIEHFTGTFVIDLWKSNEMSEENIENITKSEKNFTPDFIDHHLLRTINFIRKCLIISISISEK